MKKLLGTLLAAAMVFSTMAFAAPITEPVETADEISSISEEKDTLKRNNDASLMEDSAGYYDPSLGIRLFSEDFSSKETGILTFENGRYGTYSNGFSWSSDKSDALELNIVDDDENRCLKITAKGVNQYPNITFSNGPKIPKFAAKYTFKARFKLEDNGSVSGFNKVDPQLRGSRLEAFTAVKNTLSAGEWADTEYSITSASDPKRSSLMIIFGTAANATPTVYMDDMALYYKPTAPDTYDVSVDFPTVTVTAANGFDANAVEAITAEPAKYISGSVESVAFTGTTMTITLKSADEFTIPSIVNAAGTATYPETKVSLPDYNTLLYGLKNYYWSASSKSIEGTDVASKKYEFKNDETVGDYLEITYDNDIGRGGVAFNRDTKKPYGKDEPYTYTYLTKIYLGTAIESSLKLGTKGFLVPHDWTASTYSKQLQYRKWLDYVIEDYVIEESAVKATTPFLSSPYIYFGSSSNMLRVAYAGLYYKPVKAAAAPAVTSAGNTVTVTYSEGIDEDQTVALKAYYTKYFGGDVAALTVNGNDVAVTLADGVKSVTMPALVNTAKDAVYPETLVEAQAADLSPVTLNEKDVRLTSENSGLRFKAYVLHENLASIDEYGYIVALEKTLTDNGKVLTDLTFELDKNTVKYVSKAAYIKGREVNYIFNKNYSVGDDTADLFTGVLTGIPKGRYDLNLVARPYAKSGTTYYYGEPISGNVQAVAKAVQGSEDYNNLSAEKKAIIDDFAANPAE